MILFRLKGDEILDGKRLEMCGTEKLGGVWCFVQDGSSLLLLLVYQGRINSARVIFFCPDELVNFMLMQNICIVRAYRDCHKLGAVSMSWVAFSSEENLQKSYQLLKVCRRTAVNWKNRWDFYFFSGGRIGERCMTLWHCSVPA